MGSSTNRVVVLGIYLVIIEQHQFVARILKSVNVGLHLSSTPRFRLRSMATLLCTSKQNEHEYECRMPRLARC